MKAGVCSGRISSCLLREERGPETSDLAAIWVESVLCRKQPWYVPHPDVYVLNLHTKKLRYTEAIRSVTWNSLSVKHRCLDPMANPIPIFHPLAWVMIAVYAWSRSYARKSWIRLSRWGRLSWWCKLGEASPIKSRNVDVHKGLSVAESGSSRTATFRMDISRPHRGDKRDILSLVTLRVHDR